MRIQHNIMAMNAYRNYTNNVAAMKKNLERLSSGYKINRAGDDAAGLAISEKMRAQITGLETAQKNAKDGISLVQTAEGALTEVHDMLNRMVELATQSANGTYDNSTDRYQLQKELNQLRSEINRIADSANFNGIKLLDGSLDAEGQIGLTTDGVADFTHILPAGIAGNTPEAGGGTKGTFTITIDQLFGDGDSLTINWGAGAGLVNDTMVQGDDTLVKTEGADDVDALTGAGSTTLTFGANADFTGLTIEDQAASIAEALEQIDEVTAQFDISVKDNKVILTNKIEGNDQATVTSVTTLGSDSLTVSLTYDVTTSASADGTAGTFTFKDFFTSTTGWEFEKGDTLTFELVDANGNTWTAHLELGDEIFKTPGQSDEDTWNNILAALTATADDKAIYFEDNEKTVADESKIKFSDLFTTESASTGKDLKFTAKDGGGVFEGTGSTMTIKFYDSNGKLAQSAVTAVVGAVSGKAETCVVALSGTAGTDTDGNFSYGDKLTLKGVLSDGGEFEIEVTIDEELIGDTLDATMKNLVDYLTKSKDTTTITYTDADGNETTRDVALKDIFSTDPNKNEFMLSVDGTGDSAKLKITSSVESKKFASSITGVDVEPAKVGALQSDLRAGVQKTAASSSLTIDGLEEGATISIGGTTYQFVTDAADADEGNTAIVLEDFTDANALAALKDQLEKDLGTDDYTVSISGSTLTITTTAKGSDVTAPEIKGGGKTHTDITFNLDPNRVKAGSTITINGQKFEFVNEGGTASEGNIAVKLDLNKATSADLNAALKEALESSGVVHEVRFGDEAAGEDPNYLYICSDGNENVTWAFEDGHALKLQIGDTNESFNQLTVNISDCHTWSLGINDISIADQDSAGNAIDKIKSAINYVSDVRGTLGATQNRLDHTINNLSVMTENIQDAESTIRDTDIAEEMMAYTKNNILIQSAQAMLAQANQVPQGVLQLLQ